jgi:hypothetical protein
MISNWADPQGLLQLTIQQGLISTRILLSMARRWSQATLFPPTNSSFQEIHFR